MSSVYFKVEHFGPWQVAADLTAAFLTGTLVSIPVSIIDTSIIESLKPGCTKKASTLVLEKVKWLVKGNLHRFYAIKGYNIMTVVYVGTYIVANFTQTFFDLRKQEPGIAKAISTAGANIPLTMWKDYLYAPMFGIAHKTGFPPLTMALFFIRDFLTMYFSFTLPMYITRYVDDHFPGSLTPKQTYIATSLGCPMFIQLFSTVMHIYAFDYYNRREPAVFCKTRWDAVRNNYVQSVSQRFARIFAAYGCGSLFNTFARVRLHQLAAPAPNPSAPPTSQEKH